MGTGSATVRPNGQVDIPQSSLSFQPVEVQVNLPDPSTSPSSGGSGSSPAVVTVQAVATSAFSGGIDPANGSAFLAGNLQLLWSSSTSMNNCSVGPFRVVTRSNAQGAIPYSSDTGSVSMVDPNPGINAVPNGASGCAGDENAINSALSLPITPTTTTTRPGQPAPAPDPTPRPAHTVGRVGAHVHTGAPRRRATAGPAQPDPDHDRDAHDDRGAADDRCDVTAASGRRIRPAADAAARPAAGASSEPQGEPPAQGQQVGQEEVVQGRHEEAGSPAHRPQEARSAPRRAEGRRRPPEEAARKPSSHQLSFVPASFVKRSPSALATGLNLAALLGLLVFSSLALWLVTSELAEFKAGARRQRAHRIAGVTDNK